MRVCFMFFRCCHPDVDAWLRRCADCGCVTTGLESYRVMSRLLLVSLLFVSVPCSVLDVGGAGAEPVQVTTVLCIVDMILKEHLWGTDIYTVIK